MELLQLKYFDVVAKYENMTKAAKQLCVAQPAISQSIGRLEEELGVLLFTRNGKRIKLSLCGQLLLNRLPSILNALENVKLELSDLSDCPRQHLRLKVLSASAFLPELLSAFKHEYPAITFSLIQNTQNEEFDLCIYSLPFALEHTEETLLMDEEILIAVPQSSIVAANTSVSLHDLANEDFISLSKETAFRGISDYYCKKVDFHPNIIFESDNPSIVRGLISVGLGVAFWPSRSWGTLKDGTVKVLHIDNIECRRSLYIGPPAGKHISKTAQIFNNFAVAFFNNL